MNGFFFVQGFVMAISFELLGQVLVGWVVVSRTVQPRRRSLHHHIARNAELLDQMCRGDAGHHLSGDGELLAAIEPQGVREPVHYLVLGG
jgi:hypothetical protein